MISGKSLTFPEPQSLLPRNGHTPVPVQQGRKDRESDEPGPDLRHVCGPWRQSQSSPRSRRGFTGAWLSHRVDSAGWTWVSWFPDGYEVSFPKTRPLLIAPGPL